MVWVCGWTEAGATLLASAEDEIGTVWKGGHAEDHSLFGMAAPFLLNCSSRKTDYIAEKGTRAYHGFNSPICPATPG